MHSAGYIILTDLVEYKIERYNSFFSNNISNWIVYNLSL